jgi:hypothetical protein
MNLTATWPFLWALFVLPALIINLLLQIFNEHSNFRGQMKKIAREVVKNKYPDTFCPDFEIGNQLEEYEMVKDNVTSILNNGIFLRGGTDENVGFFSSSF